jgi:uncharacterized protein
MIDAQAIVNQYYPPGEPLSMLLWAHGCRVRDKALAVAAKLRDPHLDPAFIAQAALLHDIGIFQTAAPAIYCHGAQPYVCHGVIGRAILERHGLPRHALVCERHVGTGLTIEEIERRQLPLPLRDMRPQSLEEIIICYADKFFSKSKRNRELSLAKVLQQIGRHGQQSVEVFLSWHQRFGA